MFFNKKVNKVTCDLHIFGHFADHNLFKYILCLNDLDFLIPKKTHTKQGLNDTFILMTLHIKQQT